MPPASQCITTHISYRDMHQDTEGHRTKAEHSISTYDGSTCSDTRLDIPLSPPSFEIVIAMGGSLKTFIFLKILKVVRVKRDVML